MPYSSFLSSKSGVIESVQGGLIRGWVCPGEKGVSPTIVVEVNGQPVDEFQPKPDMQERVTVELDRLAFTYAVSPVFLNGAAYLVTLRLKASGDVLENSPVTVQFLFESQVAPFQATRLIGHRVLVLAPHPDDESLACGGTLRLHTHHRDPVKLVVLTDGRAANQSGSNVSRYIKKREAETRQAARILGITDIEFWEIPDRTLLHHSATATKLSTLLSSFRPTLIYAPSLLEFHPDHRATAELLIQAVIESRHQANVAFYEYNTPLQVNCLVDISSVVDTKRAACEVYRTQHENFAYADFALSLNRYRALTISHTCQAAEGFLIIDSKELIEFPDRLVTPKHQLLPTPEHSQSPLVSIIVRTKNRPFLLRQALASVAAQTYANLECVVINDGGMDVREIVDSIRGKLSIQYHAFDQPVGRTAAANCGLKVAGGDYFNFLDDDDVLYPQHVEKLVTYLHTTSRHFAYSDCATACYRLTPDGLDLTSTKPPVLISQDFDRSRLYVSNFIPIMTAMFSRKLYETVGPMDETFIMFEDWDYWIRMAAVVDLQRIPGVSAQYRFFSDPKADTSEWTARIYAKHMSSWFSQRVIPNLLEQIEDLKATNLILEEQLKGRSLQSSARRLLTDKARSIVNWLRQVKPTKH